MSRAKQLLEEIDDQMKLFGDKIKRGDMILLKGIITRDDSEAEILDAAIRHGIDDLKLVRKIAKVYWGLSPKVRTLLENSLQHWIEFIESTLDIQIVSEL